MTLKGDAIFKKKLTDSLKNDIRNLVNFHGNRWKSENLDFDGLHLATEYKFSAEKVQISLDTEEYNKPRRKTKLLFEKWREEFR